MVRLSLVNMYLHGFTDPHVVEYDTLTSEERWNETVDVILANPPFMSPKGGIKPHKRFSVQATRSEVLFVDYIAEHLSPQGRAAIVVPEGIIFQSGSAYKQLREMLVKTSLVAVVSLPAGVFNPYSGVKTSILILDKRLAKSCDSVLFVKVGNDGFNLGAQRRAIAGSELPESARELRDWMRGQFNEKSALATRVERARIGETGEWSLSGERYQTTLGIPTSFKTMPIGEVVSTITPPAKLQKESYADDGRYPIIDQSQQEIAGWTDDERAVICPTKPLVIFGDHTCAVKLVKRPFAQGADGIKILETGDELLPEFLFYFLKSYPLASDGYKRHFTDLKRKTIPLPPLTIQHEIVAEIESYQKIIDGARQVVENYRPRIELHADWKVVRVEEICLITTGKKDVNQGNPSGQHPFFTCARQHTYSDEYSFDTEALLIAGNGEVGAVKYYKGKFEAYQRTYVLHEFREDAIAKYCYAYLDMALRPHVDLLKQGNTMPYIKRGMIADFEIPLPDLETQRTIVAEIEAEQALVNANKQLIERFEAKIKATINRVWGSAE
jgi:type I restriction enzyme M protein